MLLSMPTVAALTSSCDAAIAEFRSRTQTIVRLSTARTFATVVLPLENASAETNDILSVDEFAAAVADDPAVRDASRSCAERAESATRAVLAQPPLYQKLLLAAKRAANRYERALAQRWVNNAREAGAAVAPAHRVEFERLSSELTDLETRFANNLAQDETTVVVGRRQLGGIPNDLLATYQRRRDGSAVVPVNDASIAFLTDSTDENARQAYWTAYQNRAWEYNVPIFERALAVRDRLSHLLGYESWADYRFADRHAGSVARMEKFLSNTLVEMQSATADENESMRNAIATEQRRKDYVLQPWDVSHAEYLVAKTHSPFDANEVRQYFPAQHTVSAILDLCHTLFGVDFTPSSDQNGWSPDVLAYHVNDSLSGVLLGYLYFDLYARPGKIPYFESFTLETPRTVGSGKRPAIAAIVGNWPRPVSDEPELLSHADVVTLFHEFGRTMAAVLAATPYETLNKRVDGGFVDATTTQIFENFAWQPSVLAAITSNWRTGEPMPAQMIAQLVASRDTTSAFETSRQLATAAIDLHYHSMGAHVDSTSVWAQDCSKLLPLMCAEGTHPQVAFEQMMDGYDAALYTLPWSRVYAQDLFTAFAPSPLDPDVGMRYRTSILAPARSQEPDAEVANFLGRPMNPAAFFQEFQP